jgi:DNA repair photolyase
MPIFLVDVNRPSLFGPPLASIDDATMARYHAAVYDGCEFGCAYCEGWGLVARPLNESVRMMANMTEHAAQELALMQPDDVIGLVSDSDAYQPAEQRFRRTRLVLRALADKPHPVVIMTKSPTVQEDIELLAEIHAKRFAMVIVTVVSHTPDIQHKFEDKAASFAQRMATVSALKKRGIPVGVALMPLVPYINDTDYALTQVIQHVAAAGADFVYWDYLRMPNVRHRNRMNDVMIRVGNYPISYLRELYREGTTIDPRYRSERDAAVLRICDDHRVSVRLPYPLFRGRFGASYTVSHIIAHQSSRDALQGRHVLAAQGIALAEAVRDGEWPIERLKNHPTYALFRELVPSSNTGSPVL